MTRPTHDTTPDPEVPMRDAAGPRLVGPAGDAAPIGSGLRGLGRDGHLTRLGLERLQLGEADAPARAAAEAHLAGCAACAEAWAALQAEDAALPIPLPPLAARRFAAVAPAPSSARRWGGLGVVLAVAAAVLLLARPWAPASEAGGTGLGGEAPDRIQIRGGSFELDVYIHDGTASRAVDSGAVIHGGDRARFRVLLSEGAFLMVAGMDDRGDVYAGYPQEDGAAAVYVPRTDGFLELPTAIEFDDIAGSEHLFAMVCDHPFGLADFKPVMQTLIGTVTSRSAPEGCHVERIDLNKQARGSELRERAP